jgi:exosortase/archaeosortase family protein
VWSDAPPRVRTGVQVGLLLLVVLIAYNYSLRTMLQVAGQDTPLAYVSLVPAFALALAAVRARPIKPEPAIHDRQVDYIIGIPLMAGALAVNLLLPAKLSAMYWVWRIDLLTLPFFVAGAVAIIFGVRVLWRQKLAVAFLFFGWPYPYQTVLLHLLNGFTSATLAGMRGVANVTHVAKPVGGVGDTLFVVSHGGHTFAMSVVSACSGVNSVVGFLLVGSAFAAIVRGPAVRKMLWLLGGMFLVWAINLGRITFIFWAGRVWGEKTAIQILHPFIGLVTFSIGVLIMTLLIRPLGMHIGIAEREAPPAPGATGGSVAARAAALAVPKLAMALVLVLVAAIILGAANLNLRSYDLVADASGSPKLVSFVRVPVTPVGWHFRVAANFGWAKPLFGDTSIWNRYILYATEGGNLHTSVPVVADVINTPDLQSFSAYGVEQCYQFHGYALTDVAQVSLTGGITGQAMSYRAPQYGSWSIVYWIVPVRMDQTTTSYERVVLYVQNAGQGAVVQRVAKKQAGIQNLAGSLDANNPQDRVLLQNRNFLVAFARQLLTVQSEKSVKELKRLPGTAT